MNGSRAQGAGGDTDAPQVRPVWGAFPYTIGGSWGYRDRKGGVSAPENKRVTGMSDEDLDIDTDDLERRMDGAMISIDK